MFNLEQTVSLKIVFLLRKVYENFVQCALLELTLPSSGGNKHYSSG
jgi:hypothetical protein